MILVPRIEIWRRERPAAGFHLVIPLHNKLVTYCSFSRTLPYQTHLKKKKIQTGMCRHTGVQSHKPISIDVRSFLSTLALLMYSIFLWSCLAYQCLFSVKKQKRPRQLSVMLPTVKTKCLMRLPTVLKNYRVRTKKTFIFIAFQIPPALYMREISARTVFL